MSTPVFAPTTATLGTHFLEATTGVENSKCTLNNWREWGWWNISRPLMKTAETIIYVLVYHSQGNRFCKAIRSDRYLK